MSCWNVAAAGAVGARLYEPGVPPRPVSGVTNELRFDGVVFDVSEGPSLVGGVSHEGVEVIFLPEGAHSTKNLFASLPVCFFHAPTLVDIETHPVRNNTCT